MLHDHSSADDWLDRELGDLPLPRGLLAELKQLATIDDAQIDAELAAVPLPPGLLARLKRTDQSPRRRVWSSQLAAAAVLFLAVGLSYFASIILAIHGAYQPRHAATIQRLESTAPVDAVEVLAGFEVAHDPPIYLDASALVETDFISPARRVPEVALASLADPVRGNFEPVAFDLLADLPRTSGSKQLLSAALKYVLGSSEILRSDDELPEIHKSPGFVRRGIEPPGLPGYPLDFQERFRQHPVVDPSLNSGLAVSTVPLHVPTDSHDLTRRMLADGELPWPEVVRTEEFLAAMEYRFPSPGKQRVGLHLAGGPSPLGGAALRLLQVGVQVGPSTAASWPATHITLLVDVSRSMLAGDRLEMVRRALPALVSTMRVDDSLSLVVFSETAEVYVEFGRPADAADFQAAIEALRPQGGTNVAAGLQLACTLASYAPTAAKRRQVLLISDGLQELDSASAARIAQGLKQAATDGLQISTIDLSRQPLPDSHLAEFARAGTGRAFHAATEEQIRWAALETLSGASQVVAADAELTITFNPQAVAGYRLLGHEASLRSAPPKCDLQSNQTATGLYELLLKPKGGNVVATARLSWRDPISGKPQLLTQTIQRGQFASTYSSETPALQLATLAAEFAEILRRSRFREPQGYVPLRELASQATSEARQSPTFADLMGLIQRAERARPARANDRRGWSQAGLRGSN